MICLTCFGNSYFIMEFFEYIQVLWKRKWWGLSVLAAVVSTTAWVTWHTPNSYQASSKLLIEQKDRAASAINQEIAAFAELSTLSRTGSVLDPSGTSQIASYR
jgi:uncharacterized protein involved in exopolysaccharide biosynthesis